MAKLQMQKIEIIAPLSDGRSIVERLQRRGVIELYSTADDRLIKLNTDSHTAHFERNISAVSSALECLYRYSGNKHSILDNLQGRKQLTTQQFAQKTDEADKILAVCHSVLKYDKRISDLENESAKAETRIDTLKPWFEMDLAPNFRGTKYTRCFIGTFPFDMRAENISENLCGDAEIIIISARREQTCAAVICHKDYEQNVLSALRNEGFAQITDGGKYTPAEEISLLKEQIEKNSEEIESCNQHIRELYKYCNDVKFLLDFLTMKRDKYIALSKLSLTLSTIIISGYIPKKYVPGLTEEFEKKYTAAITVSEPSDEEEVPVLLANGRFSSPVEGITEMYALPGRHDVDPSPVMAFFYYLFFGMMLSDAGYGLLMLIGTTFVLKKFNVEGALKRSLTMFQYCGVSTLFWGILFGSWFGDLPQIIASQFFGKTIETTALWFEPLDDPIKLLLFSFLLGIAHLFLGLGVNFKILWSEGKRLDAVFEVIPVYLTIAGIAPIAASILADIPPLFISTGKYLAAVGIISIVLTSGRSSKNIFMRFFGGIYGLYNTATGYLSDILSYSRLLALGLATGSIAGVINLIATMPENIILKAVMLIVVGTAGHIANLGINLLGAYVHSDRLQFVELFSKFYEGGGRAFAPFKSDTKYIKFEKENIYE